MTWQRAKARCRSGLAAVRTTLTRRRVVLGLFAATGSGVFLISTEAMIRARLSSPLSRVETAIYSRPTAWSRAGQREDPIPLGALGGALTETRVPQELDRFPEHLVQAILAIEDQRFFEHHGLDLWRIGGALVANLKAGRITQGGSTITQQLAKNLFLSSRRTPLRKLREAAFATVLELRVEKRDILEAYLNEIYLGQDGNRAIHGIGAAARYYFGKSAGELTIGESAVLAGMIRAPNRYNPIRHPESARQRRDLVLETMAAQDRISESEARRTIRTRVRARAHPSPSLDARYYVDALLKEHPLGLPRRGGIVYSTLDPTLQQLAERAIRDGLRRFRSREVQAALVAIDPRTGDVLAMVGGRDYGGSQFNRATDARRQPGSAFKPVVALAALSRGKDGTPRFTLASRIEDVPLSVRAGGTRWEPTNYDRSFRGEVSFREAIENSLNVPVARIGLEVGADRIARTGRNLGIESPLRPVPSLALGSSEVTLLELVRAYGVFAAGGRLARTRMLLGRASVHDPSVEPSAPDVEQVANAAEAYLVTSALEGVIERGTGRAIRGSHRFRSLAGKTGTSNDWRDAWFVAYTPELVVGVWVGFDDGRSLKLSGARAALPIVSSFLQRVEPTGETRGFEVPDGIETGWTGEDRSGWWEGGGCGNREVFLEGTAPETDCVRIRLADWLDERLRSIDRGEEWTRRAERAVARFLSRLLEEAEERVEWERER